MGDLTETADRAGRLNREPEIIPASARLLGSNTPASETLDPRGQATREQQLHIDGTHAGWTRSIMGTNLYRH